ncbi:MAG: ACT domain-containing protein [Promethearchaeia archaeon]
MSSLTQVSVFLENIPGVLSKLTKVLMDKGINMRAVTVAETADYGILRMLVDKPEQCVKVLKAADYLVKTTQVLAVDIPDKPGALYEIAKILGDKGVNIEYLYSTLVREEAIIIIRVDDLDNAVKILKDKNVKLIESQEF